MGKKRLLYSYGLMLHELSLKDMREAALRTATRKNEKRNIEKCRNRTVEVRFKINENK